MFRLQRRFTLNFVATLIAMEAFIGLTYPYAALAEDPPEFLTKWGSLGSGDGQFHAPFDIAADADGNIYVADTGNNRVQKFDSSGTFLTKWGSLGSGNGQFNSPIGIAVDGAGNVYVAEYENHRIQKFDSNGTFLAKWGFLGSGDGQFVYPHDVGIDGAGNVYVAEHFGYRIQKFDSSGTFLTKWGSPGSGDGQFIRPVGIVLDDADNVYVVDRDIPRVQKFDSSGTFLTKWGSYGSGDGQLKVPYDVAVDSAGNVYVADLQNHRIQKFDASGTFLTKWGVLGVGDGQFDQPIGVALDSADNVYVVELNNRRVQVFGSTPPPEIAVTPLALDYGMVDVFQTREMLVTVQNTGGDDLTVTDVWLSGLSNFSEMSDGFSVTPGAAVDITVTYAPTDVALESDSLIIESDDPVQPTVSVDLVGEGVYNAETQGTVIEDTLQEAVAGGTIEGAGSGGSGDGRLAAFSEMLQVSAELLSAGLTSDACGSLLASLKKVDGDPRPPDFVTGESAALLEAQIELSLTELGCVQ